MFANVQVAVLRLAGGFDVAADVQPILGGVLAGEAAGYPLLCIGGPHAALADVVRRPDPGVCGEPQNVGLAVAAELQQVAAGVLGGGVLPPGDAGDAGQPDDAGAAELSGQRVRRGGGDLGEALLAGVVPGADQAAQCPLLSAYSLCCRMAFGLM